MRKQVIWGAVAGLVLSILLGAIFLVVFYVLAKDLWESSEMLWEGILQLIACIIITIVAVSLLRMWRAEEKWEKKLRASAENTVTGLKGKASKYGIAFLTFTVVLREGLESVLFVGGVGSSEPGSSIPIAAITGILAGVLVGVLVYLGGSKLALRILLMASSVLLLLMGAGLLVRATHEFEEYTESETILWELECCSHKDDGFWRIMNAVFGWRNEGTLGTTLAWFLYWVFVAFVFFAYHLKDKRTAKKELDDVENTVPVDANAPAVLNL
jgi:high-affinity iron transporter